MKKRNILALALGTAFIIDVINNVINKKTRTKDLIELVWACNKESIVKDLGLKQEPILQYDENLSNSVMYTSHDMRYKGTMFTKEIVETIPDYIIHINLPAVEDIIKQYQTLTFNKDIGQTILKQLFLHESRHIWQAQGDFYIGTVLKDFEFDFGKGYGTKPEERDANEYAISKATNKRELSLFTYQKEVQDTANTIYASHKNKGAAKNLINTWNPFISLFV